MIWWNENLIPWKNYTNKFNFKSNLTYESFISFFEIEILNHTKWKWKSKSQRMWKWNRKRGEKKREAFSSPFWGVFINKKYRDKKKYQKLPLYKSGFFTCGTVWCFLVYLYQYIVIFNSTKIFARDLHYGREAEKVKGKEIFFPTFRKLW